MFSAYGLTAYPYDANPSFVVTVFPPLKAGIGINVSPSYSSKNFISAPFFFYFLRDEVGTGR